MSEFFILGPIVGAAAQLPLPLRHCRFSSQYSVARYFSCAKSMLSEALLY